MKKLVLAFCAAVLAAPLFAGDVYYASPEGTPEGDGSEGSPYDIVTACSKLKDNKYDEVKLLSGTYKVGSATLAAIDYYAKLTGVGGNASDAVLDFEGAGPGLTVSYGGELHNVTISNFVDSTGLTVNSAVGYDAVVISNCVVCCGRSGGVPATKMNGNGGKGPILIVDSVIRDVTSSYTYGCACYCGTTGLHLLRTTISDSVSDSWSGAAALYSNQPGALVEDCIISNNVANSRNGGAIYTESQGIHVKGTTFYGNRAGSTAGAIYAQSSATTTNVIEGCTFIANWSAGGGGAINVLSHNTVITGCTFIANSSDKQGGAINCNSSTAIIGLRIEDCTFTNNAAAGGAALSIANRDKDLTQAFEISCCHFSGNTNTSNSSGGAIQIPGFARINLTDCDFTGNAAGKDGCGGEGGAIGRSNDAWNEGLARVFCTRCTFANNRAQTGAAIAANASCTDCDFTGNLATNASASVCNSIVYLYGKRLVGKEYADDNSTNVFVRCHFADNVVYGGHSGVYAPYATAFFCSDTTFSNNVCRTSGTIGGWAIDLASPTYFDVDRCQIVGTYSESNGSGFRCGTGAANDSLTNGVVRNCLFFNNYAVTSGGAGLPVLNLGWTNTWVSCCTIVSNYVKGGIWTAVNTACDQPGCVANCVLYMNDCSNGTQYRDIDLSANKVHRYRNCFISKSKTRNENGCIGPASQGQSVSDPGFVDLGAGDFRLAKDSPCVDAGVNEPWMVGARDIRNKRRYPRIDIDNRIVDMGCYEYRPTPGLLLWVR